MRYIITSSANRKQRRLIDTWTQESLGNHFNDATLPTLQFGQTPVQTPSATYDAVFILHHAVRHMITEGISLRQICDWTMYLHRHHSEINETELHKTLKKFHMTTIWKEFGILAINILGLDPIELPVVPERLDSKKTSHILNNIFLTGNFGHYDKNGRTPHERNVIKRKWRSLCVQTLRFIKLSRLFPRFTLSYCAGWYPDAIVRLFSKR